MLTPDGRHVVGRHFDGWADNRLVEDRSLYVWDARTGAELAKLPVFVGHSFSRPHLWPGPNGSVAWQDGKAFHFLNMKTLKLLPPKSMPKGHVVTDFSWAPSGRWVAVRTGGGLRIWNSDLVEEKRATPWDKFSGPRRVIALDDERMLAFHTDFKIRVWNIRTGANPFTLDSTHVVDNIRGEPSVVSPDGQALAVIVPRRVENVVTKAQDVHLWNLATGKPWCEPILLPPAAVNNCSLCLTSDHHLLVAIGQEHGVEFLPKVKYR
jgi:WD40 repeat protein